MRVHFFLHLLSLLLLGGINPTPLHAQDTVGRIPITTDGNNTSLTQQRRAPNRIGKKEKNGLGGNAQNRNRPFPVPPKADFNVLVGVQTQDSAQLSIYSQKARPVIIRLQGQPPLHVDLKADTPCLVPIKNLAPDSTYTYTISSNEEKVPEVLAQGIIQTQKKTGRSFTFCVQGDSHPERTGKMYHPDLYTQTLKLVARNKPDFYFLLGDDFSMDRAIERDEVSPSVVNDIYKYQRGFLGLIGENTQMCLVNGNHEFGAKFLINIGKPQWAQTIAKARTTWFPLPATGKIYSVDPQSIPEAGLLKDYAAWEWGDCLFVIIDPYWHSESPVDHGRIGGINKPEGKRDLWQSTLGDEQYKWLTNVLTSSQAKWKFVFAHHVLGTGRGGIEMAHLYEWGGYDPKGNYLFKEKRPLWKHPIHELFKQTNVSAFFQGHDHLYVQQELDGIIYQTCPCPADDTHTAFNADQYKGTIKPNSGFIKVSVSPEQVLVEYISSSLNDPQSGQVSHSYTITTQKNKSLK